MRCSILFRSLPLLALLPVAACQQMDPYTRSGMWQPSGVVDRNFAAQVANPADLVRGQAARGANSPMASAAVTRWWQGQAKPLPATTSQSTTVAPSNGGGGAGGQPGGS